MINISSMPSRAAIADGFAERGIMLATDGRYGPNGEYIAQPLDAGELLEVAWFFDRLHGVAATQLGVARPNPARLVIGGVPLGSFGPDDVAATAVVDGHRTVSYNTRVAEAALDGMAAVRDGRGATGDLAAVTTIGMHEGNHVASPMDLRRNSDEAAADLSAILQSALVHRFELGLEPVRDVAALLSQTGYGDLDTRMIELLNSVGAAGSERQLEVLASMVRSGDAARTGAERVAARHRLQLDESGLARLAGDIDAWIGGVSPRPELVGPA